MPHLEYGDPNTNDGRHDGTQPKSKPQLHRLQAILHLAFQADDVGLRGQGIIQRLGQGLLLGLSDSCGLLTGKPCFLKALNELVGIKRDRRHREHPIIQITDSITPGLRYLASPTSE